MLIVAILAILAIPATCGIVVLGAKVMLNRMLLHIEETKVVGGQPLQLVLQELADRKEMAAEAREDQAQMLEAMRIKRREALG